MAVKRYDYLHLINGEIASSKQIHPFNDREKNDLRNKSFFIKTFQKDLKGKTSYLDISGKNNLFNFTINNENFNIFVEHSDGGGADISFNRSHQKVLIPYSLKSFCELIKDMKNVLVIDLYFELTKNKDGELVPNKDRYCYLIIIPSEFYTSEVTHNILFEAKEPNGSSRWVKLSDIKTCIDSKKTMINHNRNVWLVHPSNLNEFLKTVVLDDYKNQLKKSYFKLLELQYSNTKIDNIKQKQVDRVRQKLRQTIISRRKCEILSCNITSKECLVASHIWPVNRILMEHISWDDKIKYIGDPNNAFLLCGTHDKLLDKFLISFNDDGSLIASKLLLSSLSTYSLSNTEKIINVNNENKFYLKKHREIFYEIEANRVA